MLFPYNKEQCFNATKLRIVIIHPFARDKDRNNNLPGTGDSSHLVEWLPVDDYTLSPSSIQKIV